MNQFDRSQMKFFLADVAREAGQAALEVQSSTKVVKDTGGGGGITTQADLDAQQIVVARFQKAYPNIPIVGEEGNTLTVCPDECFIVDPIDGSAPYKAGSPDWSTTLAYRSRDFSEGVIYLPAIDRSYRTGTDGVRVLGQNAKRSFVISLEPQEPKKPQWRICCPITREFSDEAWSNVLLPMMKDKRVRALENLSCNTVHFIRLFEGWDDAVIMWAKAWDSAAALPMAKLLDITVTDFNGNEPDLSIIEPQRLVFARGQEVLDFVLEHTTKWPSPENEMRQ